MALTLPTPPTKWMGEWGMLFPNIRTLEAMLAVTFVALEIWCGSNQDDCMSGYEII
jgi:hypothetical protein